MNIQLTKIRRNQALCLKIKSVMKFLIAFFLFVILNLYCSDSPRQTGQHQKKAENNDTLKAKPPSSYSDTIKISSAAAVFYTPDSLQLEKIKGVTEPMIFESAMHDCFYQMRNSRIILKQYYAHVKIIEAKNARYLRFDKSDNRKEYVDLNSQNDPCGIIIFDGQKTPRLVDMTNLETELGFYFAKETRK